MKIVGLAIARSRDQNGISWDTPLNGVTLLEQAVQSLGQMPYTDEVHVLSDSSELLARGSVDGARVSSMPDWFFEYNIPFFTKEQWLLARAMQALDDAGTKGDVLLIADWRTPLVHSRTMEVMYHKLMDDRIAARTAGTYKLDPNLYLRLSEEKFFPAWADIGADRQNIPQLYRTIKVGAIRPDRLVMPSPETRGIPVTREEGLRVDDQESLELAQFYIRRRKENGKSPA